MLDHGAVDERRRRCKRRGRGGGERKGEISRLLGMLFGVARRVVPRGFQRGEFRGCATEPSVGRVRGWSLSGERVMCVLFEF